LRVRLSQFAAFQRLPIDVQEEILLGTVRASERDLRGPRGMARERVARVAVTDSAAAVASSGT
jgi:hypothetical protein